MNIQKINWKPPPVHAVIDINIEKQIIITACGRWLDDSEFKEVKTNVTCNVCLRNIGSPAPMKDGGLTHDKSSS